MNNNQVNPPENPYILTKNGFTVTYVPAAGGSYSSKSSPKIPNHRSHRTWALNVHPVCSVSE
jgi:Holliday junction resolvase RusA-like endonuclease